MAVFLLTYRRPPSSHAPSDLNHSGYFNRATAAQQRLVDRGKPYGPLAARWTAFEKIQHYTSPTIDGGAFASVPQATSSHTPSTMITPVTSIAPLQRDNSRTW